MYLEIISALEQAANDASVITAFTGTGVHETHVHLGPRPPEPCLCAGAGDFYCSGNDLTNFTRIPEGGVEEMARKGGELLRSGVGLTGASQAPTRQHTRLFTYFLSFTGST